MTVARSSSPKVFGLRPFKVMVSAITLVAFFVNIFSYDLITLRQLGFSGQAWAAGTPLGLSGDGSKGAGGSGLFNELKVDTFALPENLGRVQFSWSAGRVKDGGRQATIIHIQDAHCNYAAQKQVAAIIEYLRGHYGIEIVNMEGGSGGYDLSVFTDIADGQKRRQVSDYFVREGLVSGGEYAAINDPEKIKLWGIEDPALYLANLNIYLESLSYRDDAEALLKSLSTSLSALKPKVYSKELLEFDMEYGAYKAGNIPFKDHLVYVLGRAGVPGTGVDEFRNLSLLGRALEAESGIDFKKADKDRDELIDRMHKKISRDDVEEIVAKTVEFKKEKISQKQFHDYLLEKAAARGVDTSGLGQFLKYADYVAIYSLVDKNEVMGELSKLEDSVRSSLCRTDEERELARLSKNLALMRNIFSYTLTRDDYGYYLANRKDFDIQNYLSFIGRHASLHGIAALPNERAAELDRYREESIRFYEMSFRRDEAFLKNLKTFPLQTANNKQPTTGVCILVTGGFHTENLLGIFRKRGISYISIMPEFRNEDSYKCPYFSLLSGKKTELEEKLISAGGSLLAYYSLLNGLAKEVPGADIKRLSLALRARAASLGAGETLVVAIGGKEYGVNPDGTVIYADSISPEKTRVYASVSDILRGIGAVKTPGPAEPPQVAPPAAHAPATLAPKHVSGIAGPDKVIGALLLTGAGLMNLKAAGLGGVIINIIGAVIGLSGLVAAVIYGVHVIIAKKAAGWTVQGALPVTFEGGWKNADKDAVRKLVASGGVQPRLVIVKKAARRDLGDVKTMVVMEGPTLVIRSSRPDFRDTLADIEKENLIEYAGVDRSRRKFLQQAGVAAAVAAAGGAAFSVFGGRVIKHAQDGHYIGLAAERGYYLFSRHALEEDIDSVISDLKREFDAARKSGKKIVVVKELGMFGGPLELNIDGKRRIVDAVSDDYFKIVDGSPEGYEAAKESFESLKARSRNDLINMLKTGTPHPDKYYGGARTFAKAYDDLLIANRDIIADIADEDISFEDHLRALRAVRAARGAMEKFDEGDVEGYGKMLAEALRDVAEANRSLDRNLLIQIGRRLDEDGSLAAISLRGAAHYPMVGLNGIARYKEPKWRGMLELSYGSVELELRRAMGAPAGAEEARETLLREYPAEHVEAYCRYGLGLDAAESRKIAKSIAGRFTVSDLKELSAAIRNAPEARKDCMTRGRFVLEFLSGRGRLEPGEKELIIGKPDAAMRMPMPLIGTGMGSLIAVNFAPALTEAGEPQAAKPTPASMYGTRPAMVFAAMPVSEEALRSAAYSFGGIAGAFFNIAFLLLHWRKYSAEVERKLSARYESQGLGRAPPWLIAFYTLMLPAATIIASLLTLAIFQHFMPLVSPGAWMLYTAVNTVLHSIINLASLGEVSNLFAPAGGLKRSRTVADLEEEVESPLPAIDEKAFAIKHDTRRGGANRSAPDALSADEIKQAQKASEYDDGAGFRGVDLEHYVAAITRIGKMNFTEEQKRALLSGLGLAGSTAADRAGRDAEDREKIIAAAVRKGLTASLIDTVLGGTYKDPRLERAIEGQNPNAPVQGTIEAVSNMLDALGADLGQFGKGVKQILTWLEASGEDRVDVLTLKDGRAFRLTILKSRNGQMYIRIDSIDAGEFKRITGADIGHGTLVRIGTARKIPRKMREEIAEEVHGRFCYVPAIEIVTKLSGDAPRRVNGFKSKHEIVPYGESGYSRSASRDKRALVFAGDRSLWFLDNGSGMDLRQLALMFAPGMSEKTKPPLDRKGAEEAARRVKVVRDDKRPREVKFLRNGEAIITVKIPTDEIFEEAVAGTGIMVELGRLLPIPESRDKPRLPSQLRGKTGFKMAILRAIEAIASPSHPFSPEDKIRYINTIVLGLEGLVQDNPAYENTVRELMVEAKNALEPIVSGLERRGYVFLPHQAGFAKLAIPPQDDGISRQVIYLHPNLFGWQGISSMEKLGAKRLPQRVALGGRNVRVTFGGKELMVMPFTDEALKAVRNYRMTRRAMLEGEGLPFVESDDFIAVPELPTTEELLRLAAMPERSEDEEYRLTALLELINIMTAKEVVTDYEITKPREHIKVEEVSGEVPSGRPGDEERGLPDDALAAAFLMNPPAMPKPADERPPVEEMATQEKAPRAPATPHAEASAAAPPGAAAPTAVPDAIRCHFYMRYDLSTDKSEIIDAVTGRLYAPADLGIPDDADMKFLGRDATTEYYSIDLYEESYHKVIGLKRSDDGLIRVSSGLQVEGGYKWGSLDDRFIFAKTQVGYKCFDSKTGKVSSVDEKGRLVNAQFIESTGELMLILERRNGMLELVRFDPRKMEPAGMPIPLWKGRGTDAEFDQIGPFVHIRAVGRRPFRLKGEGVVITRYGEVYRDIAEIEVHLPDGLLITKNAKGGNTSIIRTKTGKDGEQAGTEMYYVDGKYKVYHNGVTGAWEILAKAKEARGSRLRRFGGAYAKSRISRWPCLPDKAGLYDISDDADFYRNHSRWRPETKELELSESMAKELGINRQPLAASYNPAWDLFVVEIPGPEKRRAIVDIPGRKVFWMQSSLVAENIIYYDREKGEIGIDYDSRLHVVSDGKETDYGVFKHNYLSGGNATYYVPGRCVSVSIDADSLRPEAHTAEIDDRAAEGYKFVAFDNGYLVFIKSGTTEFKYLKIPEAARAAEEARPAPVEPPAAGPAPAETAPVLSDEEQMKRIDTLLKSSGLPMAGRLIGTSGREWILDLYNTAVSDISLLEGCTNIKDLRLSGTNIKDLTPIRSLKNLEFLRLDRTQVGDLTPLANLKGLSSLNINSTRVRDLTPLFGLPKLRSVYARGSRVERKDVYELFRGLFRNNAPNLEGLVVSLRFDIQIDISKVPREYVILPAQPSAAAGNRPGTGNLSDDKQAARIIPLLKQFGLSDEEQAARIIALLKQLGLDPHDTTIFSRAQSYAWRLDLKGTGIKDLSPLEGVNNLRYLILDDTPVEDLRPISGMSNLSALSIRRTGVKYLKPVGNLVDLVSLNLGGCNRITDFRPLSGMNGLEYLDLSKTRVKDLAPLRGLSRLRSLLIDETPAEDLEPLAGLENLETLDITGTNVRDLRPLYGLPLKYLNVDSRMTADENALYRFLYVMYAHVIVFDPTTGKRNIMSVARPQEPGKEAAPKAEPTAEDESVISKEASAAAGSRSGTGNLSDEEQAAKVIALLKQLGLDPENTNIFDKAQPSFWRLDLRGTRLMDLSSLEGVKNLRYLVLDDTLVEDLRPIAGLNNLATLSICRTRVKDLKPISDLAFLRSLSVSGCDRISDFSPLGSMKGLEYLSLSKTRVKNLAPLSGLSMLSHLFIDNTPVRDLAPLAGLKRLEALHINGTNVQDLRPLYGLPLKYLSIDYRITADEDVLYRFLYVMHTEVTTFDPATGAINKMSPPVARPQEPGEEAAPEAEPTAEDEPVIPKEAAAAAGPSAALSAEDELEEAWHRTFLRSGERPALRERILDGFRASWESGLFDIIPERYRASVSAALSPVLSRLYDSETKFVNRIFLENRETTEDMYEAEDMPFARFISRIAALKSGLRAFLASPQAAVMMQDYETGKKYLTNIAASLFELAAEEHEHAIPEPDGVFYHMLGLGWSVAQEWQRPAASLKAIYDLIYVQGERERVDLSPASAARVVSYLSALAARNRDAHSILIEQVSRLSAHPRYRSLVLQSLAGLDEKDFGAYMKNPHDPGVELGEALSFLEFLSDRIDPVRRGTRWIPAGEDWLGDEGVWLSQLIKADETSAQAGGRKIMSMRELYERRRSLPAADDRWERSSLLLELNRREPGAHAAEITQNSKDEIEAMGRTDGELVVDFYVQKGEDGEDEFVEESRDNGRGASDPLALLIFKSTKAEGEQIDLTGFFGSGGKGPLYRDVDRLELITKSGDEAYYFECRVIKNDLGEPVAIKVAKIRKADAEGLRMIGEDGVIVRRIKKVANTIPELDQKITERSWLVFAGAAPTENFKIYFRKGETERVPLKVEIEELSKAEWRDPAKGPEKEERRRKQFFRILRVPRMPNQIIDNAGLRVASLDEDSRYARLIPRSLRYLIKDLHIVIQVPLPQVEGRGAFKREDTYLPWIQLYIAAEFYRALARKTLAIPESKDTPQFVFRGFPHDWLTDRRNLQIMFGLMMRYRIAALLRPLGIGIFHGAYRLVRSAREINRGRYERVRTEDLEVFLEGGRGAKADEAARTEDMVKFVSLLSVPTARKAGEGRASMFGQMLKVADLAAGKAIISKVLSALLIGYLALNYYRSEIFTLFASEPISFALHTVPYALKAIIGLFLIHFTLGGKVFSRLMRVGLGVSRTDVPDEHDIHHIGDIVMEHRGILYAVMALNALLFLPVFIVWWAGPMISQAPGIFAATGNALASGNFTGELAISLAEYAAIGLLVAFLFRYVYRLRPKTDEERKLVREILDFDRPFGIRRVVLGPRRMGAAGMLIGNIFMINSAFADYEAGDKVDDRGYLNMRANLLAHETAHLIEAVSKAQRGAFGKVIGKIAPWIHIVLVHNQMKMTHQPVGEFADALKTAAAVSLANGVPVTKAEAQASPAPTPAALYGTRPGMVFGVMPALEETTRSMAYSFGGIAGAFFNIAFLFLHWNKYSSDVERKLTARFKSQGIERAPPKWMVAAYTLMLPVATIIASLVTLALFQHFMPLVSPEAWILYTAVNTILHSAINLGSLGEISNLFAPANLVPYWRAPSYFEIFSQDKNRLTRDGIEWYLGHLKNQVENILAWKRASELTKRLAGNDLDEIRDILERLKKGDDLQERELSAMRERIYFLVQKLIMILQSQAWLSPTYTKSGYQSRGLLQDYAARDMYERDGMYTSDIEKKMVEEFGFNKDSTIFRNSDFALFVLINILLQANDRELLVSDKLEPRKRDLIIRTATAKNAKVRVVDFAASAAALAEEKPERGFIIVIDDKDLAVKDGIRKIAKDGYVSIIYHGKFGHSISKDFEGRYFYGIHELSGASLGRIFSDTSSPCIVDPIGEIPVGEPSDVGFGRAYSREISSEDIYEMKYCGGFIDGYTLLELALLLIPTEEVFVSDREKKIKEEKLSEQTYSRRSAAVEGEAEKYMDLKDRFGSLAVSPEMRRDYDECVSFIGERLKILKSMKTGGEYLDASERLEIKEARESRRALLKFLAYFKMLNIKDRDRSVAEADSTTRLEAGYNSLIDPVISDDNATPRPMSSLLCSSGMASSNTALSAILLQTPEDKRVLIGNNVYFEIDRLIGNKRRHLIKRFDERKIDSVISEIKTGKVSAVFLEPIANSHDYTVADLGKLTAELCSLRYKDPFYLVIDASVQSTGFQIAKYLNGLNMPENLHIVMVSSLQKLDEEGLELSTGGAVTIVSATPAQHARVLKQLRDTRNEMGTGLGLRGTLLLESLGFDRERLTKRTRRINQNALSLAEFLNGFPTPEQERYLQLRVVYPGLTTHPDHSVAAANYTFSGPYLLISGDRETLVKIDDYAREEMSKRGIINFARDSYGFDHITLGLIAYYKGLSLRVSLGAEDEIQMAAIKEAFGAAFTRLADELRIKAEPARQAVPSPRAAATPAQPAAPASVTAGKPRLITSIKDAEELLETTAESDYTDTLGYGPESNRMFHGVSGRNEKGNAINIKRALEPITDGAGVWWGEPYESIGISCNLDPSAGRPFKPGNSAIIFEISPDTARSHGLDPEFGLGATNGLPEGTPAAKPHVKLSEISRAWAVRVDSKEQFESGRARIVEIRLPGMREEPDEVKAAAPAADLGSAVKKWRSRFPGANLQLDARSVYGKRAAMYEEGANINLADEVFADMIGKAAEERDLVVVLDFNNDVLGIGRNMTRGRDIDADIKAYTPEKIRRTREDGTEYTIVHIDHHYDAPQLAGTSTVPLVIRWLQELRRRAYISGDAEIAGFLDALARDSFTVANHQDADILLANFLIRHANAEFGLLERWAEIFEAVVMWLDHGLKPSGSNAGKARMLGMIISEGTMKSETSASPSFEDMLESFIPAALAFVDRYENINNLKRAPGTDPFAKLLRSAIKRDKAVRRIMDGALREAVRREGILMIDTGGDEISSSDALFYLMTKEGALDGVSVAVFTYRNPDGTRYFKLRTIPGSVRPVNLIGIFRLLNEEFSASDVFSGRRDAGSGKLVIGESDHETAKNRVVAVIEAVMRGEEELRSSGETDAARLAAHYNLKDTERMRTLLAAAIQPGQGMGDYRQAKPSPVPLAKPIPSPPEKRRIDADYLLSTIAPEEIAGTGLSYGQVAESLVLVDLEPKLPLAQGFEWNGLWNQTDLIEQAMHDAAIRKAAAGEPKEITIYQVGVGEKPVETNGIIYHILKPFMERPDIKGNGWKINIVLADLNGNYLRLSEEAAAKAVAMGIGNGVEVDVRSSVVNMFDLDALRTLGETGKADLILSRYNSYTNSSAMGGSIVAESLKYPVTRLAVIKHYLSIRNVVAALAKRGTIFVTEPVGKAGTLPEEALTGREGSNVLMVPGAKLILANQYLIEERKVPAASIGNRGTGMYEILDPEAMRRGGLAAFLKAIRDSSEPDHGMVSVLVAETDVELLPRVNFASSSEALDYYLAETPLGTRGEGDRWGLYVRLEHVRNVALDIDAIASKNWEAFRNNPYGKSSDVDEDLFRAICAAYDSLPADYRQVLFAAAALHDYGRFFKGVDHYSEGAGMVASELRRLGWEERQVEIVSGLIRHHSNPRNIAIGENINLGNIASERDMMKTLGILGLADIHSSGDFALTKGLARKIMEIFMPGFQALTAASSLEGILPLAQPGKIDRAALINAIKEKLGAISEGGPAATQQAIRDMLSACDSLRRAADADASRGELYDQANEIEEALRLALAAGGMGRIARGRLNIVAQLVPDAAMRSQADPANRIIEDILMRGYNSVETKSIINTTDEIDELVSRTVSALGDDPEARAICIIPVGMRAAFTEAAKSAGLWDDARAQKKFFDYGSPDAQPDPVTQFAFGLEFLEYCRTSPDASASASPKLLDLIVALTGCSDPQDALRKLFAGDVFVIRAVNWRNLDDRRRAWRSVETAL